ncbi:MAG TPA: 4-hydroxythreonine-4-phosphate dehydrogenase PdxA [Candidatus Krumholzibacteriaceae bacterium]|nr:4-hydroxythreonine-4-phosphate dehydrogenase PdxA [Candidatus Krumholzibacteriaceae bacterium]
MNDERINIALTIGDPAGIGPEITADLIEKGRFDNHNLYIIGSAGELSKYLSQKTADRIRTIADWKSAPEIKTENPILIDTSLPNANLPAGRASEQGGRISGKAVETAVSMALSGDVEAIVTGPISKEALALAGYSYIGHTDMLADKFSSPDCQMMMVNGPLRIVIMTRDIALKDVPGAISTDRIKKCVKVTDGALKEFWGIKKPKIAVAALNPHAGDGGVTGSEEREIIIPAIEMLLSDGLTVEGPVPSDTLFYNRKNKDYDAYVALYHDQGMIPFKTAGFDEGVNMTIGLPVVRTSVCHGTAYGIAGRGDAESGSLCEAVSLAVRCCLTKREKAGG